MKKKLLIIGLSTSISSLFGAAESEFKTLTVINETPENYDIRVSYGPDIAHMNYYDITRIPAENVKRPGESKVSFPVKYMNYINLRVFKAGETDFSRERSIDGFSIPTDLLKIEGKARDVAFYLRTASDAHRPAPFDYIPFISPAEAEKSEGSKWTLIDKIKGQYGRLLLIVYSKIK